MAQYLWGKSGNYAPELQTPPKKNEIIVVDHISFLGRAV
jgi:hypothetical protein